ncbi:hypothetical protein K437DRAFT_255453 [Tilletiaria anomala UBC 951]|uniref:Chromatin assembly factor 1 subunit A dimerization domain-containing protein n=1 Tax=Tilletiaria anomala (strain ATCC 24038 / CBS 436.72 / UBC 951) TaxID=1037660 RepID=A0A066WCV0_TILAU|nr:uncharacterized protein K437DRAFT_255453 [Tilletiaria anomala UBC 951]KDN48894.1 hypothetical protein K437DRAFT_255453 [Tilletiaria anomala UBC 951]
MTGVMAESDLNKLSQQPKTKGDSKTKMKKAKANTDSNKRALFVDNDGDADTKANSKRPRTATAGSAVSEGSLVAYENGRLVMKQKAMPWAMCHETLQGLLDASIMLANQQVLQKWPDSLLYLVGLLAQDSDQSIVPLSKCIQERVACGQMLDKSADNVEEYLPCSWIQNALNRIAERVNYGLESKDIVAVSDAWGTSPIVPAALQIWCWEMKDTSNLPPEMQQRLQARRQERSNAKQESLAAFLALERRDQDTLLLGKKRAVLIHGMHTPTIKRPPASSGSSTHNTEKLKATGKRKNDTKAIEVALLESSDVEDIAPAAVTPLNSCVSESTEVQGNVKAQQQKETEQARHDDEQSSASDDESSDADSEDCDDSARPSPIGKPPSVAEKEKGKKGSKAQKLNSSLKPADGGKAEEGQKPDAESKAKDKEERAMLRAQKEQEKEEKAKLREQKRSERETEDKVKAEKKAERQAAKAEKQRLEDEKQAEKEKKVKEQARAANFFASFLKKQNPEDKASAPKAPETPKTDFDKTFLPCIIKNLAPINRFNNDLGRDITTEVCSGAYGGTQPGELLADFRSRLPLPLRQRQTKAPLNVRRGFQPDTSVREVMHLVRESDVLGDVAAEKARKGLAKLRSRRRVPIKLLQFHSDRRPGWYGTWTRSTKIIGPRTPFGQDSVQLDYSLDSDAEWEDEAGIEGEDLMELEEEEAEMTGSDSDSDMEDWLDDDMVLEDLPEDEEEDDNDVISLEELCRPGGGTSISPLWARKAPSKQLAGAAGRGTVGPNKKKGKKRRQLGKRFDSKLIPFSAGPHWETTLGTASYSSFKPYQIEFLNDAYPGLDPFTFGAGVKETVVARPEASDFTAPAEVDKVTTAAPGAKKPVAAPKAPFPETHTANFVRAMQGTKERYRLSKNLLVAELHEHFAESIGKWITKRAIEFKLDEVAIKPKGKAWQAKPEYQKYL